MIKIVVTNPMGLTEEQKERLQAFGEVKFYDTMASSTEEWLKRCEGFDVVCSWMVGLREGYGKLKNVFISVPFVGIGSFIEPATLKANNISISNSPGCNRHAVSEWVVYMILTALRRFDKYLNTTEKFPFPFPVDPVGLAGKRVYILGKGNIGKQVGAVCEAFEMKVSYFVRGGNLADSVKEADIVVDVMSTNPTTKGILNKDFFNSLKKGATFISVTAGGIVDADAMLEALDNRQLTYIANDMMSVPPGDASNPLYEKFRQHPNVFVTPHIAGFSDVTTQIGNDMMIDNIEAWLKGKPINLFKV